jgi:hypothetical protein
MRDCHAIKTAWPILQSLVGEINQPQTVAIAERLRLWAAESAQQAADDQAEGAG